jgi:O-antigen/teichoic acid export membrane protein
LAGRVLLTRILAITAVVIVALAITAAAWPEKIAVVAVTGAVAIGTVSSADWLGRAIQRTGGVALASVVGGITAAATAALVLALHGSYVAALGGFASAELVASLLCWRAVREVGLPDLGLAGSRPLLREAWPVAISSVVIYSYYANLDTIILASSHGTATAGVYSAAYRVFLVFNAVAIFVAYANFPTLSRASVAPSDESAAKTLHTSVLYLFAFGAVTAGVAVLAGGDLLGLMFGAPFRAAGHTFALLCVGTLWYLIGFPLGYSLIASGRNRRFLAGAGTAGVLSVSLDLALIPPFGMIGAAIANAICFAGGAIVWIVSYRVNDRMFSAVAAGLLICTLAVVMAVALPAAHIALGAAVVATGALAALLAHRAGEHRES